MNPGFWKTKFIK